MGKTCATCGGIGMNLAADTACPECHYERGQVISLTKQDIVELVPVLGELHVPRNYIGTCWSSDIFWAGHGDLRGNKLVELVISQMEKIHSLFASGDLLNRSLLLLAPAQYGKMTFGFSCMQYAVKSGYSVAPLLDTSEIKRLLVLSSEQPTQRAVSIDYESYISADLCIFTVQKNEYRRNAYSTILDLLDKRSRRGLSTIGLSRYSMAELSRWDRSGDFMRLSVPTPEENLLKIPAILSCL